MPTVNKVHYYEHGTKEKNVLVLLHGAGGRGKQWPYQIRRLPKARVFALDLPGHGLSTGKGFSSVEDYADKVLGWMGKLELESVIFVGHSMGAAIALSIAAKAREKVKGMVLIGASQKMPVNPTLIDNFSTAKRREDGIKLMVRWSFAKDSSERLRKEFARQLSSMNEGVVAGDLEACDKFDLAGQLERMFVKTLILRGEEDLMISSGQTEELGQALPYAEVRAVARAGHMAFAERPRHVAKEIEVFLEEISQ